MFIVLRLILKLVWLGVLLWAALSAALFAIMWLPPADFAALIGRLPRFAMPLMVVMPFEPLWNFARSGPLREGDPAPDFELERHDKSGSVRLSAHFGERPVVLVFGSYT